MPDEERDVLKELFAAAQLAHEVKKAEKEAEKEKEASENSQDFFDLLEGLWKYHEAPSFILPNRTVRWNCSPPPDFLPDGAEGRRESGSWEKAVLTCHKGPHGPRGQEGSFIELRFPALAASGRAGLQGEYDELSRLKKLQPYAFFQDEMPGHMLFGEAWSVIQQELAQAKPALVQKVLTAIKGLEAEQERLKQKEDHLPSPLENLAVAHVGE